jgi:putative alpha-1,2-mannosidase
MSRCSYHANAAPTNFTEFARGGGAVYRGMDLKVHSLPVGESRFSDMSIW